MENPATWGEAEKVVNEVLKSYDPLTGPFKMGLSLTRQITDALRAADLLKEGK